MDFGDRPAECRPSRFIGCQRNRLLPIRDEMGTKYGPYSGGGTGTLKLHCAIDPVGIGAG
jgi:hypothetical protein